MKASQKSPEHTAASLYQQHKKQPFHSHHLSTSVEQLAQYRQQYAQRRALHQQLWRMIDIPSGGGQITVKTQFGEVAMLVDRDMYCEVVEKLAAEIEKDLVTLESWLLAQAAYVEQGVNECGLDASEQDWAAYQLLNEKPVAPAAHAERCPFLPDATTAPKSIRQLNPN